MTNRNFKLTGYDILELIGTGAHSSLWKVRNQHTGETRTLKRVVKLGKDDEKFFNQTINEFEAGKKIAHPSVRKVFEIRKVRKLLATKELHLLMEFCPGKSIKQAPPKTIREAADLFSKTAIAMLHINQAGFIHADMKPDNIIQAPNGNIKIIDLGQCCKSGTIKDRVQGTPDFIAPEQVHKQPLTPRTDVYNFGATMYWCLTGKPGPMVIPPTGSLHSFVKQVDPPSKHNPDVPVVLDRLILSCMEQSQRQRPESMKEIASRLRIILAKLHADRPQ